MYDCELVVELLNQILISARRIERRITGIQTADDFLTSDEGIDGAAFDPHSLTAEVQR